MVTVIPIKDSVPRRKTPFFTWLLILVNVLVLVYQNTLARGELSSFVQSYGFIPSGLVPIFDSGLDQESLVLLSPLLTSQFLHGSWVHLLGNMWILFLFGDNVEDYIGHIPYILFYLVGGVFASLAHYLFNASSQIPAIGASGAVAAVMGAYFILFPRARVIMLLPLFWIPFFFRIPAVLFIGFWVLNQFLLGINDLLGPAQQGGVAWWAHIGGFVFGALIMILCRGFKSDSHSYEPGSGGYRYRRR